MQGRKIRPVVKKLLSKTGIDLSGGGGIPELLKFQEHFRQYKITVYRGLACEDVIFQGQVDSSKKINRLYDDVEQHYHVIVNITGAMPKTYVCKACNKWCRQDVTHVCEETCSDCMASPPCVVSAVRIPCSECNRHFRSKACFANHKQSTSKKKTVCGRRRNCATCGTLVTRGNRDCNKRYCETYNLNRNVVHLFLMRPLKGVLPANANKVLYVFFLFRDDTKHEVFRHSKRTCN